MMTEYTTLVKIRDGITPTNDDLFDFFLYDCLTYIIRNPIRNLIALHVPIQGIDREASMNKVYEMLDILFAGQTTIGFDILKTYNALDVQLIGSGMMSSINIIFNNFDNTFTFQNIYGTLRYYSPDSA